MGTEIMNRIALSVSKNFVNKENMAAVKNNSNRWAFAAFDNVSWTPQQIIEHVKAGHAICVAATANNHRKSEYFKSAQIMGVDFDHGPDVTGLLDKPLVYEYAFMVYATPSSTPAAPRSRALFALDAPINDPEQYKRLVKRLLLAFNADNIDDQCKDTVRIFYGCKGKETSEVSGAVLPIVILETLPQHPDELKRVPDPNAPQSLPVVGGDYSKYVQAALDDEIATLRTVPESQNNALNKAAFALGQLVGSSWTQLGRFDVEQSLYDAMVANGYVSRDGEHAARATIRSGIEAGMKNPRPVPLSADTPYRRDPPNDGPSNFPESVPLGATPDPPFVATWHTSVESMQRYRERLETARTDGKLPLVFPFKALHDFGGFCRVLAPGVMIGVVGLSGGLKTSFVETITDSWKQMDDNDVLWYGPEWSWERMADRAVQRYGGANFTDVMLHEMYLQEQARGQKTQYGVKLPNAVYADSVRISKEIEQWSGMNHYIEQMDVDIDDLLAGSAERLLDAQKIGRNIRVAVWDYLQLMDMRSVRSESERITTILGRLKAFCVENSLIGIVASQVTKTASADTKENQKLLTSEAGQFFRGDKFNLVLTLNPVYDGKALTDKGYINVDKNSIGKTGAVQVFINPARLKWVDSIASSSDTW